MSLKYNVGIVGLGAIGLQIAQTIDLGKLPQMRVSVVCSRDHVKAKNNLKTLKSQPSITSIENVAKQSDVIIE
ncbi:MAG: NAD(P)-binding domain-containing protein, partial [Rhodospirillaceae bacterium]|nr:NAD(P)-binding domain-containing protein [Rhodospirillaceae bacterium]